MEDIVSIHRLELLHPKLVEKAKKAYREAVRVTPTGIHPFVTSTLRTFAEQTALYAQGRTRPGQIVTNSKAGQSLHNYGAAFDLVIQRNGKFDWEVNDNWMQMINVFKDFGFEWGGDWKGFKDYPHVQFTTFGGHRYSWQDLLKLYNAGKRDKNGYVIL